MFGHFFSTGAGNFTKKFWYVIVIKVVFLCEIVMIVLRVCRRPFARAEAD